ncbi:MAG TPA: ATP-binding protein [Polyangiaceae bacterium]|nr:ATP-binding protein [Polyangiaceae bacterium]
MSDDAGLRPTFPNGSPRVEWAPQGGASVESGHRRTGVRDDDAEAICRAAFENASDSVLFLRAVRGSGGEVTEFVVEDANDAAAAFHGLPRAELRGKRWSEIAPHASDEQFVALARVADTGEPHLSERSFRGRDSLTKAFRIRSDLVCFTAADVTERRRAERAIAENETLLVATERKLAAQRLRAEKERLAITLRSIGDAVIVTDDGGRVTLFNPAAVALTGFQESEAIGRPLESVFQLVEEKTSRPVQCPGARTATEGMVVRVDGRLALVGRSGDLVPVASTASAILHEDGSYGGDVLVLRDQTQERRAEAMLERSRSELLELIERLPLGVFVTREDRFVYANQALSAYLGQSPAELIGRKTAEFGLRPDGTATGTEHVLDRPDGTPVTLEFAATKDFEFEGSPAKLWACRDMSELLAMKRRLIDGDRLASLGMLAAGVAHEINNPLAYVTSALEVLKEDLAETGTERTAAPRAEIAAALRDALQGTERVKAIVRDLRAFSRPANDEQTSLVLADVLDSAIGMARHELRPRARLVKDYGTVPRVTASEARLGQVFLNLLINAAHAMPLGTAEFHEIRVTTRTDDAGRVVVEIRDDGCGIARENLARVFDPFFTTKGSGGTGLGLAICRNTIASLGGELTLESEVGRGTTARVVLSPASAPAPEAAPPAVSAKPARRARVLVVDDEAQICTAFGRILRGHDVVSETDALAAWERIRRGERFDVVFCDLMMPGVTGLELHARLTKEAPDVARRFVFTTGGTFTESDARALEASGAPMVDKPFVAKTIRDVVNRAIE